MRLRPRFIDIKAGGGGFSRKLEDQTDTLLLTAGSKTPGIVKHVLQERPFSEGCLPLSVCAKDLQSNIIDLTLIFFRAIVKHVLKQHPSFPAKGRLK
jgi:hypothetical protein